MISLLLSTLVTASFATGQTLVMYDVAPMYVDSMFSVDPVFMQREQDLEAALQFEALQLILSELQQAMEEKRMFEELMFRLEEQQAEREWAAFITRLQHDPQFAEMVFEQYPEFFDQFNRGAQPEEQQQKFHERYPEVQAAVYNPLFPTDSGDVNGDLIAASREDTETLVKAQIAIDACAMTTRPAKLNYFTAIGLTSAATTQEVKKAYQRLSRHIHPDKNNTEQAKTAFQALNKIYTYFTEDSANLATYAAAVSKQSSQ